MECVILYSEPDHQTTEVFSASVRKSFINLTLNHLIFSAVSISRRKSLRIGHMGVVGTNLSNLVCNTCSNLFNIKITFINSQIGK